jgi:Uma2 family endonuclease
MVLAIDQLEYLKKMINFIQSKDQESEQILVINNVTWYEYEELLDFLGDKAGIKIQYREENLAIMSPSRRHEIDKKIIGILLECYFLAKKIRFYPLGSTTLKNPDLQKGIEPDQCYCLHNNKNIPDLAIEIIVTSGGLNSLEIYAGLGVKEVWFWQKGQLSVYVLGDDGYRETKKSILLPDLDLDLLINYLKYDDPFDAVSEFQAKITNGDIIQ